MIIALVLTLSLLGSALIVAIIFRILDAMRYFGLIYVLTRENLIDFDKFS